MIETIKRLNYYGFTHIGLKREKNEDAYIIHDGAPDDASTGAQWWVFAVADGIGGHSCGEQASALACRELKSLFGGPISGSDVKSYVKQLEARVHEIDRCIRDAASKEPLCEHMGTTLSAMLVVADVGITAHVGDSRIYRLRNGRLSQLTSDHTFVQEMIDEGDLAADAATKHPLRNMLTRSVGTQMPLEQVEIRVLDLTVGDRFLISSDGLHKMVPADEIAETLKKIGDPRQAAERLLRAALENGGRDNITGIIIRI